MPHRDRCTSDLEPGFTLSLLTSHALLMLTQEQKAARRTRRARRFSTRISLMTPSGRLRSRSGLHRSMMHTVSPALMVAT